MLETVLVDEITAYIGNRRFSYLLHKLAERCENDRKESRDKDSAYLSDMENGLQALAELVVEDEKRSLERVNR